ncbi:MAG TPA: hypothetical protein VHE35_29625 [Kofleriaceae bacterium]|nr:hypothetical protein [Kofleriaceae bacterium]
MSDDDAPATVSISVRLRRTIVEEVHVSVPVTAALIAEEPDGSAHLDGAKVFAAAVRLGGEAGLAWRREGEVLVELHPLQTPPPGIAGASGPG